MKTRFISMLAFVVSALLLNSCSTYAQSYGYDDDYGRSNRYSNRNVTVQAENSDISYNLDLRAVANLFADSRDLEEFERRLNDYDTGINNLDLNRDGQVDYLRVIETAKGNTHLVVLQSVVGYDMFQDVASIVVERKNNRRHYVQVIGDPYIYGPYYIIEPVYVYVPPIFSFFWGPRYYRWHSPYYWGYYPSYWHHWSPYHTNVYVNNVNIYVDNSRHTYRYSDRITNNNYNEMRRDVSRSDYQRSNPDRSFSSRNADRSNVSNRRDLDRSSSRNSAALTNRNSSATRSTTATNRGDEVNSSRNTRSAADVNSRSTQTRSSSTVTRNSGAVRSAEQWDATRNSRGSSGVESRSQGTTRSSVGTTNRGSYEQSTRSGNSSSRGSAVTPRSNERSSSTYGTPSRSSSSRSSGSYSTPSSSGRSSGTYSTPSSSSSSSRSSGTVRQAGVQAAVRTALRAEAQAQAQAPEAVVQSLHRAAVLPPHPEVLVAAAAVRAEVQEDKFFTTLNLNKKEDVPDKGILFCCYLYTLCKISKKIIRA